MFGFQPETTDRPKKQSCSGIDTQSSAERFLKAGQKPASNCYLSVRICGRSFQGILVIDTFLIDIILQIESGIRRKRSSISDWKQRCGFDFRRLVVPELRSMMGTPYRTRKDQTR